MWHVCQLLASTVLPHLPPNHWPKCLPIILLRHTVRMCIISCCSCSAGNVLRASSWANFSLLLQLRVRHFRIATVIILITNTKALNLFLVLPLSLLLSIPSPTKKEINFYLTRLSIELAATTTTAASSFVLCLAF